MAKAPVYHLFATALNAKRSCEASGNDEWFDKWDDRIRELNKKLPSGSGFDCGSTLDEEWSTDDKLVFTTSYHHMDEGGGYDGWTDHTVIVRPSLIHGITLTIGGRNRNDIKDYMADIFYDALTEPIDP